MNKRQRKKFNKKLNKKSYYKYREAKIYFLCNNYLKSKGMKTNGNKFNAIYIIDSKRMDLKHPIKVELLLNCYPSSVATISTNEFIKSVTGIDDQETVNTIKDATIKSSNIPPFLLDDECNLEFNCSTPSFTDQMINYAIIHKEQLKSSSNKLTASDDKLNYSEFTDVDADNVIKNYLELWKKGIDDSIV